MKHLSIRFSRETSLRRSVGAVTCAAALSLVAAGCSGVNTGIPAQETGTGIDGVDHIVVIYMENHSFDKLYGQWGDVNGMPLNGLTETASLAATQVSQVGKPFDCLLMTDVNLTSPPLASSCTDETSDVKFTSAFPNKPFTIDDYISDLEATCPFPGGEIEAGTPAGSGQIGGCTRDLIHRFYQNQFQINGGKNNKFMIGSDSAGLVLGMEATRKSALRQYLHTDEAPKYVIADNTFASAFGSSFLNHQFLISNQAPEWPNATNDGGKDDLHSVIDEQGMPTSYELYKAPKYVKDGKLTASCQPPTGTAKAPSTFACGDFAVNTTQPPYQPYQPGTPKSELLPAQSHPTVGDQLEKAGIDWAWYSGGWSNADGRVNEPGWANGPGPKCIDPSTNTKAKYPNCPNADFQYHHQPFNYYKTFAPGTQTRRERLRDEVEFLDSAANGKLKQVSYVKPIGEDTQHPGYASTSLGSDYLVKLIKVIQNGPQADKTLIVVTYDEFGGAWDHVAPPTNDEFGPGTRIPAMLISNTLPKSGVDSTTYVSFSVSRLVEEKFGLEPLNERAKAFPPMIGAYNLK